MILDRDHSTVTIAGRLFPAALIICPDRSTNTHMAEADDEYQRSLGGGSKYTEEAMIPAENGVIFNVEQYVDEPGLLGLELRAPTCEWSPDGVWLPQAVTLVDGSLEVGWRRGDWYWQGAEPEWVVETIDRLSRKPFTVPPGPSVRLVPLNYFTKGVPIGQ